MYENTEAVVSPQASYRDITDMAWQNINGIKRYWYLPPLILAVLGYFFLGGLSALNLVPNIGLPARDISFRVLDIIIFLVSMMILLGQQRVALGKLEEDDPSLYGFFHFDQAFVQFFLLQMIILGISFLFSLLVVGRLSLGLLITLGIVFSIGSFLLEIIYHYLGFGIIQGRWSALGTFTQGIASLRRQSGKILRVLGHVLLWILVFYVLGFLVFDLGLRITGSLLQSSFGFIAIFVVGTVLTIRLAVFFELVVAGIYLQDVAQETPNPVTEDA
ncbi:MAG: hypothetical protein AAF708_20870 [Deinococcota bacterium]